MKKLLSVILAALLMLSVIPLGISGAFAEDVLTVYASEEIATVKGTAGVKVSVKNNTGFGTLTFKVEFDTTKVSLTSVTPENVDLPSDYTNFHLNSSVETANKNGWYKFGYTPTVGEPGVFSTPVTYNGLLATFNFTLLDTVSVSDCVTVTVTPVCCYNDDADETDITWATANGKIDCVPVLPEYVSATDTKITLKSISGYQYKMGSGDWQDSNVFEGLSPHTAYKFFQRQKSPESKSSAGVFITTDKSTPAKPSAPTSTAKTDTTVTLTAVTGNEYKCGSGNWQESNVFTGLSPATEYSFYQRVAATASSYVSDTSDALSVTTDKSTVSAPAAPTSTAKTDTTVTLTAVTGNEYKCGSGNWQTSNVFTGLSPATEYSFYQRVAETTTSYASDSSTALNVTTDKSTVSAPAAPTLNTKTDVSVTLTAVTGNEYKCGEGAWQESNVFTGLSPATEYNFYQRVAETTTTYASNASLALSVTTDKSAQAQPSAPTLAEATSSSIKLTAVEGAEYKMGEGNWQTSNEFTGLTAETSYTFYIRLAETDTAYASPSSLGATLSTTKPYTPGDVNGDDEVDDKDITALKRHLAGWTVTVTEAALDINGDDEVDDKDVTYLARYLAGWTGYALS